MEVFAIVTGALLIVYPIASLDRDVKWRILFKYLAETVVVFVVLAFALLFILQDHIHVETGGGGSGVFWLLILGVVVAAGEIVGYLRYKRYLSILRTGAPPTLQPSPNSLGSIVSIFAHILSFLKVAILIWFGLFVAVLVIGGPKLHVPSEYVEEFHCLLIILALLSAGLWKFYRRVWGNRRR